MAKQRTAVTVNAAPEVVFGLLERDRTTFRNDELNEWEALGDLPFGPGYRFRSTGAHSGKPCVIEYRVTVFDRPFVFEEEWHHHCAAAERTSQGRDRFELQRDGAGTILIGTFERKTSLLDSFFAALTAPFCGAHRLRLARLGIRAEAVAHATA